MHLIFEKVILNNFLSFKYAELELDNNGYVVVSGVNQYAIDGAKSNGAGKSSIWDAISWCLTGETIRGVKDVVNNLFKDNGCYVELHFKVNDLSYKLIRSKDHKEFKTNLKIYVNDQDKSGKGIRDSEKILAELLPELTSSFIGSVIILGQGLPERFTNNTPAGRKEILEKLSKSDFMINDIKQFITTRQIALQQEVRKFQDISLSLESKRQLLAAQLATTKDKLDNIGTPEAFQDELRQVSADYELLKEEIKTLRSDRDVANSSIQFTRARYSELNQELQEAIADVEKEFKSDIDTKSQEINTLSQQIYALKSEISRLENIKDVCPTCGQKLPGVEKPDTSQKHQFLEEFTAQYEIYQEELKQLYADKQQRIDELNDKFADTRTRLKTKGDELDLQLRQLDTSFVTLTNKRTELDTKMNFLQSKIDNFYQTVENLKQEIALKEASMQELSNQILYNKAQEENLQAHLDIVSKMMSLATREFRGVLLSNVIAFINSQAKSYSADIFGTARIDIVLDGNNIEITYDNKTYSGLSGGEKQKVDIIVQLAIRDMLSKFMGYSCNILVLDEIFDNLDSTGCDKLLNMFAKKLSDLRSIYIVSHHADSLNIPYDKEVLVVKTEQGYSEIR